MMASELILQVIMMKIAGMELSLKSMEMQQCLWQFFPVHGMESR